MSSRRLGGVHSRFCNRQAHAFFLRGKTETELVHLRRKLALREARFRVRHAKNFKTKHELDAVMINDSKIKDLESEITKLEVQATALDAALKSFDAIIRAASREMTRRDSEHVSRD